MENSVFIGLVLLLLTYMSPDKQNLVRHQSRRLTSYYQILVPISCYGLGLMYTRVADYFMPTVSFNQRR